MQFKNEQVIYIYMHQVHENMFNIATIMEIIKLQVEIIIRRCFSCMKILFTKMSEGKKVLRMYRKCTP